MEHSRVKTTLASFLAVALVAPIMLAQQGAPTAPAPAAPATQGAPPPPPPGDQRPAFRAGVELVSLNVTVMDPGNHYITDLEQEDFSVFEDGVKQEVTFFNRRQSPVARWLLLAPRGPNAATRPVVQPAATTDG
jgi:hypothetical protein